MVFSTKDFLCFLICLSVIAFDLHERKNSDKFGAFYSKVYDESFHRIILYEPVKEYVHDVCAVLDEKKPYTASSEIAAKNGILYGSLVAAGYSFGEIVEFVLELPRAFKTLSLIGVNAFFSFWYEPIRVFLWFLRAFLVIVFHFYHKIACTVCFFFGVGDYCGKHCVNIMNGYFY